MRCVCCGYEPTKAEQVEAYGCPKSNPKPMCRPSVLSSRRAQRTGWSPASSAYARFGQG